MSELKIVYQSAFLYQVELAKSKLASRGIPSYIKNEFVNHVVVMPISQNYLLLVNEKDWENALKILEEIEENEL
ncbi:putative signal transducing protein [Bergeyella zoohelcum]|uniref:putative signal transducing protein n=1 Tax=Bergeyella zoohelcum TaxID=1015 RepID=UPI003734E655